MKYGNIKWYYGDRMMIKESEGCERCIKAFKR